MSYLKTFFKKITHAILQNKILLLIILVALLLRFIGIYPGYPTYHSDEIQTYSNAVKMIRNVSLDPVYHGYPSLVPYIHAFAYVTIFFPISFVEIVSSGNFPWQSFLDLAIGQRDINALYWGRYTNAFFGVLTIILTYLVAKRFFSKQVGILSALFLAVNYRSVLAAHYALLDVPNSVFFLIVYLASYSILTKDRLKDALVAGVAVGLSFSVKFSPFAILSPIAALFLSKRRDKNKIFLKILVLVALAIFVSVIINFALILNFKDTMKYIEYLGYKYGSGRYELIPYPYLYLFRYGLGPVTSVLSLFGLVWGLKRKFSESAILILPLVLFFFSLTFYSTGGVYVRNFVSVIPILLIFSSLAVVAIFEKLRKINSILALAICSSLAMLSIFPLLKNSLILDRHYAEPWNLTKIKVYFTSNKELFKDKKIAGDEWLLGQVLPDGRNITTVPFNFKTAFSLPEVQETGADFLLIDTQASESFFNWWMPMGFKDSYWDTPKDLIYSTLPGGTYKDLVSRATLVFTKPWPAYETNFFLIPIPKKLSTRGEIIYKEDFDDTADWETKGTYGLPVSSIDQIFDPKECLGKGCVRIGKLLPGESKYRFLGVVRYSLSTISVEEEKTYRVKVKLKSDAKVSKEAKDGFFKVELFYSLTDIANEKPGDIIFISSRYFNDPGKWEEKEVFVDVPKGYKNMVISFQTYDNRTQNFYFDDLVIEKLNQEYHEVKRIPFPQELFFLNSII